jgi:ribose transport system ATP-binding protein
MSDDILRLGNLYKSFGPVQVLKGVSLSVQRGEIHAIVGENGAGKSTLMHILTGSQRPDSGDIVFDSRAINAWESERAAIDAGLAIVYQERSLFPHLSVVENIFAGRQQTRHGLIDHAAMRARCAELLATIKLDIEPDQIVGDLSPAQQQQVEIVKALSQNAHLLILDEPTACLTRSEVDTLFALLKQLQRQGITMLYISHRLEEIFALANRVTVLKDGVVQRTCEMDQTNPQQLVSLMVGRPWQTIERTSKSMQSKNGNLLKVCNLCDQSDSMFLREINFDVDAGRIVALAGLVGAGRTEVADALFGLREIEGEIKLDGQSYVPRSPNDAIQCGIAYVTEDRRSSGIFADMNLIDNVTSSQHARVRTSLGNVWWNARRAFAVTRDAINNLSINCRESSQSIIELSGGNQQKLLISRWLLSSSKLLILDEPTRGVDVASKEDIHRQIRSLANGGMGVLLISSDLLEVLALADTIYVMREGRISGQLTSHEATEENVMKLASLEAVEV